MERFRSGSGPSNWECRATHSRTEQYAIIYDK